jgi:hypothetical protein
METRLGKTGLRMRRLALCCMSYGHPTTPNAHPWALVEDDAQPIFQQAGCAYGVHTGGARNIPQALECVRERTDADVPRLIGKSAFCSENVSYNPIPRADRLPAFKAAAFDRSATPPIAWLSQILGFRRCARRTLYIPMS